MANPRDVNLDIIAHDKTDRATKSAARNFDKLRRDIDKVATSSGRLSGAVMAAMSGMEKHTLVRAAVLARSFATVFLMRLAAATALMAPGIAQIVSGALVVGFGGGLAALGIAVAAQSEKVKTRWRGVADYVKTQLTDAAKPFEDVLVRAGDKAQGVVDEFMPSLRRAFQDLAPVMDDFFTDLARALPELEAAVEPVVDAFSALMDEIGDDLPEIMRGIAEGITAVANAVKSNPQAFAGFVRFLGNVVEYGLKAIAFLANMGSAMETFLNNVDDAMYNAGQAVRNFFINGLDKAKIAVLQFTAAVMRGMADALDAVAGFVEKIPGIGTAMAKGMRETASNIRASARQMDRDIQAIRDKEVQISARDRTDPVVRAARQRLDTVRDRSVSITAIDRATATVSRIQAMIASLRSRSVTISVNRIMNEHVNRMPQRAHGGPVESGRAYFVGEKGPEMFVPRDSGRIVPNDKVGGGDTYVTVMLGDREITDLVRTEVRKQSRASARRVAMGVA